MCWRQRSEDLLRDSEQVKATVGVELHVLWLDTVVFIFFSPLVSLPKKLGKCSMLFKKKIMGDPWVAQWFSACLWPRA